MYRRRPSPAWSAQRRNAAVFKRVRRDSDKPCGLVGDCACAKRKVRGRGKRRRASRQSNHARRLGTPVGRFDGWAVFARELWEDSRTLVAHLGGGAQSVVPGG